MADPFHSPTPTPPAGGLTLADFLARFPDVEEEANGYVVVCPAHEDTRPSLRVAYNAERKVLALKCRVGCKTADVATSLGLSMSDLFNVEPGDLTDIRTAGGIPQPVGIAHRAALVSYLDKATADLTGHDAELSGVALEYAEHRFGITRERALSIGLGVDGGTVASGIVVLSQALYRDTPRLVVPFNDLDGHAHYLQARALDRHYKGRAKWSGPANPDGASWGRYGWFPGDLPWDEIIVTEGPGDGLTSVGAGYDTLLIRGASMGLSDDVLAELVARFPDRTFIVAGDNDPGGQSFNDIVGERLTGAGLSAAVLSIPEDVGDLSDWRKADPTAFYPALTEAISSANPWIPQPPETPDTPNPAPSIEEDNLPHTELANARRLYARMDGLVRHTGALGFLLWNGAAWEVDTRNRVQGEAARSAEALMAEALALPRDVEGSPIAKRRAAALRWAHDSQRMRGLEAAVALLRSIPGVAVAASDLDAHPDLLAASNGTINLRTGVLRPADPDDLLTKALSIPYHADAKAPRWERFMAEVFPDSEGTRTFLRRLVGYGITGENSEQCFVLLHGHGANGKSVFTSALFDVFSSITANTGIETFLASEAGSGGGPSSDVAALRGARLALTSESEHGARLAEARLKRLTGGDPVQARHLYREMFTFTPTFLLFMSTNGLPEIRGTDDGIWRRIKVLEWAQKFNGAKRDTALPQKLHTEREGILTWAVRGAVDWYAARDSGTPNALAEPAEVTARTDEYRTQSDKLDGFYPGKIVDDEAAWMPRSDLYAAYQEWAETEGSDRSQMWRNTTLYSHFRSLEGIADSQRKGVRGFRGLRLARPTELAGDERANDEALTHLPIETDAAPSLDAFIP